MVKIKTHHQNSHLYLLLQQNIIPYITQLLWKTTTPNQIFYYAIGKVALNILLAQNESCLSIKLLYFLAFLLCQSATHQCSD